MCPDRQILSVYFDGELDSPWKEKFENHLKTCFSCREHLEAYGLTRQKFTETSPDPESLEQVMGRVWEKVNFAAKPRRRFWTGSITVPVPLAAAAGLAMVLALAALMVLKQPSKVTEPQYAGLEMQDMIPVSDMDSLLQRLKSDNSTDVVIIRLPDTTFKDIGEPKMLRAADYSRSGSSR